MLNLPIPVIMNLQKSKNILIMGMGGGFDVFAGIPIYLTLEKMGMKVNLANYTHANWDSINQHVEAIPMASGCLGVTGNILQASENLPEAYLASWFKEVKGQDVPVWTFKRDQSVKEYSRSLEILVKHLEIDCILLVDGGVDSIMSGNEDKGVLTKKFIETSLVLKSLEGLTVDLISVNCNNNVISSNEINKKLYKISSQGAFYGGCFIVSYMDSYKKFKIFYDYMVDNNLNISDDLKTLVNNTEFDYSDSEETNGQTQYLFFNTLGLIYNNNAIKFLDGEESYYDFVQKIAPFVNKY